MKYETALHQNVVVWARRAGLDMNGIDLDAVVYSTEKHLGSGRRGAMRWVVIEALRTSDLLRGKRFTANGLGMAIADMTYDVVYGGESMESITADKLQRTLSTYECTGDIVARGMRYADVAIDVVKGLVDARTREKKQASSNVIAEVLRKVRG